MNRYRAVVFDLWGTLVDEVSHPEEKQRKYRQVTCKMADLLGVDSEAFTRAWSRGAIRRIAGAFSSTEEEPLHISGVLGVEPSEDRVKASATVRNEFIRGGLSPRPGTVETLSTLREAGYRLGWSATAGTRYLGFGDPRPSRSCSMLWSSLSKFALQNRTFESTRRRPEDWECLPGNVCMLGTAATAS